MVGALFGNLAPSWIELFDVRSGAGTVLTDSAGINHSPIWSPDGNRIAVGTLEGPTFGIRITEIIASDITERGATRADDKFTEAAMEDRKREGYF